MQSWGKYTFNFLEIKFEILQASFNRKKFCYVKLYLIRNDYPYSKRINSMNIILTSIFKMWFYPYNKRLNQILNM